MSEAQNTSDSPDKNLTVLLVEDYNLSAQYLSQALKMCKCESVMLAQNGEDAVELARAQGPFDLVFVDLLMHGMGGVNCIRTLRSIEGEWRWSQCIVAMSANEELQGAALTAGADRFLHKLGHPVRDIVEILTFVKAGKAICARVPV